MTFAVLELNDQSLLAQAEGGHLHVEPGFARLTPQGIVTGEDARAAAWREPQHNYNQYWCHLNQTPLAATEKWARHHADIAFAQLRQLWNSSGSPESLIVLAPGSFTDSQLSLLLGMFTALPAKALAVIDNALAACLQISRDTLFVDMHLHQSVLTLCRPQQHTVNIIDQEVNPNLGLMQIYNSVARHISNLLINSFRHDPLHASESEQAIYDQLPVWLTRLRWEDEVSATVIADQGELPFVLRREDVRNLISERLGNIRSIIARHPGCHLVLSHASGVLAGLSEEFSTADIADQSAAVDHVLSHHSQILNQVQGQYRVRSLNRNGAGTINAHAAGKDATHVLYRNQALPLHKPVSIRIDDQGIQLNSKVDDEAALIVVLRNRSIETVRCASGIDTSLPPTCRPGESIVVGGHQLRLIEVRDG